MNKADANRASKIFEADIPPAVHDIIKQTTMTFSPQDRAQSHRLANALATCLDVYFDHRTYSSHATLNAASSTQSRVV